MNLNPMRFVEFLKYMGVGMLGIFMIIGIIVISTYLISGITEKIANKNKASDSEE